MGKKQLNVLKALDVSKTQWYHFTTVIIAGMGFFTDAYDLFCISSVTKLLGRIYYYDPTTAKPGNLPLNVSAAVNGVALFGTLAGHLFFGCLGDKLGRKKVYGITLILMVLCSVASGLSFGKTAKSVMTTLCFFRFWLGFSLGGEYPLSATIMSEYANKKARGAFIAAVFAMQGFGILAGAAVAIIVGVSFNMKYRKPAFYVDPVGSTAEEADFVWRIILMFGAIPAAFTYYWRMKMPETARYTALIAKNPNRAATDMSKVLQVEIEENRLNIENIENKEPSFGLFSKEFARRHGLHLVGTATTRFLLDISFYTQKLCQTEIFAAVGWLTDSKKLSAIEEVYRLAKAWSIISLCFTVKGYWFMVALIDHIGRRNIQLIGFFFRAVFMLALSIPFYHWRGSNCGDSFCGGNHKTFVVLYCLTLFFANFGPNSTTFIIPAELFPARLRSTCNGISAATGKAGAIIGSFGFLYASQSTHINEVEHGYDKGIGLKRSLIALGITNALGFFFTFLVPETNGKSLEELSSENDDEEETQVEESRTIPVYNAAIL